MNSNIRNICLIGLGGMVILLFIAFILLQDMPVVKQSNDLRDRVRFLLEQDATVMACDLQKVTVSRANLPQGTVYRVTFWCKHSMPTEPRDKIMAKVGAYMWNQHVGPILPVEVNVVYKHVTGGGCSQNQEVFTKKIPAPQLRDLRRPGKIIPK